MEVWQIKRIRRLLDLTQEEMAQLLGTSTCTVIRYERGATRPNQFVAEMLAILAQRAEDPHEMHQIRNLLQRDAERPLILWHVLNSVYGRRG